MHIHKSGQNYSNIAMFYGNERRLINIDGNYCVPAEGYRIFRINSVANKMADCYGLDSMRRVGKEFFYYLWLLLNHVMAIKERDFC